MDLSKLPRLSETDKHTPPPQPPPSVQTEYAQPPPTPRSSGAEAWFNIAIGLIIQFMSTRFWSFLGSKLFGSAFTWTFNDANGALISYTQTVFFAGDLAMVLFGMVLIAEGVIFNFIPKRPLMFAAFALTTLTAAMNLVYTIWMINKGYGLQLMAALAVAFGVYIAMHQWSVLKESR